MSGEDVERGIFKHRHAVVHGQILCAPPAKKLVPPDCIGGDAKFKMCDSPLNEYGVLGFDYGG